MEFDFRNRPGPQYASSPPPPPSSHLMYGQTHPSRTGQPSSGSSVNPFSAVRHHSFHHSTPPFSTSSPGIGIRVAIKPEYRITPPPQSYQQIGDIPRSSFHFDFDLERKIFAEAEKESPDWSGLFGVENLPSKRMESTTSLGTVADPIVSKYIASGLSRDAVPIAVANYGDNPAKVKEFVNGYTLLREMGFSPNSVAEALLMSDNDTDKALAHILNNPS